MTRPVMWQVIYEDDDLLAVSKPPFLPTAPRHRWEVCRWCVLSQTLLCAYSLSTPWARALEGLLPMPCMVGAGRQPGQQSPQLSG